MDYAMSEDESSRQIAASELHSGEQLVWAGRPIPMRLAVKSLPRVFVGLVWSAFIYFFFTQVSSMSRRSSFGRMAGGNVLGIFYILLGLFALLGVAMILSPLWEYIKASRKVYALSDRRAILIDRWPTASVCSYALKDMRQVERRGDDQQGDIIFARETRVYHYRGGRTSTGVIPIGFLAIRNPRDVEVLLTEQIGATQVNKGHR